MTDGHETLPVTGSHERLQSVSRDPAGRLIVDLQGRDEPITDARVARCFPWSMPERYISIRDEKGKECLLLESLEDLPEAHRERLEAELDRRVFNPRILRVTAYRREFGVSSVTAETDRGEVTFQIRSRDDVRLLSARRALFRDADGVTYELPDIDALDAASRKHLQQYF